MPQHSLHQYFQQKSQSIKENGLWRKFEAVQHQQGNIVHIDGQPLVCFCSNDYLGLANHTEIKQAVIKAIKHVGVGATASSAVCGYTIYHQQLENYLCEISQAQAALIFSNGYAANLAISQYLVNKGDIVLHDRLNHASLLQGAQNSRANLLRYRHNDTNHLEQLLQDNPQASLIVTDGVFSMDGDMADLETLSQLAYKYNTYLVVDDAHGFGVVGDGYGSLHTFGLLAQGHHISVITFGKAVGCYGAAVVGDKVVIDYLRQVAKNHIYTTALPASMMAATHCAIQIIFSNAGKQIRQLVQKGIQQWKNQLKPNLAEKVLASETPIQPLIIGDSGKAMRISEQLRTTSNALSMGMLVKAIRPPTVPDGTARLRIVINAEHSAEQIQVLCTQLNKSI